MSEKFQNKYRIPSTRLQNWDYGSNALYFVTICTAHRACYFGDVVGGEMVLSELGKIAETEWLKTFEMRPDMNLYRGEFVVMPNHFHAIIGIGENEYNTPIGTEYGARCGDDCNGDCGDDCGDDCRDAMHCVSTDKPIQPMKSKNHYGPQSKNLASIIRGFKSAVTTETRKINVGFAWQSRFHDHIIRNNKSFQKISTYIINNPLKWTGR